MQERWKISIKRVTTLPGADCGTDHNLLIVDINIKLKRIQRSNQTLIYIEKIRFDYYSIIVSFIAHFLSFLCNF